jgi:hypothetical protein
MLRVSRLVFSTWVDFQSSTTYSNGNFPTFQETYEPSTECTSREPVGNLIQTGNVRCVRTRPIISSPPPPPHTQNTARWHISDPPNSFTLKMKTAMFTAMPGGLRFSTQPNPDIRSNIAVHHVRATELWYTYKQISHFLSPFHRRIQFWTQLWHPS